MKILMLAIGTSRRASSRMRAWALVPRLSKYLQIKIFAINKESSPPLLNSLRKLLFAPVWMVKAANADYIYVQETFLGAIIAVVCHFIFATKYAFDFSDPVLTVWRKSLLGPLAPKLFKLIVCYADLVTCENPLLLRYTKIIAGRTGPTYLVFGPSEYSVRPRSKSSSVSSFRKHPVSIGWIGTPSTSEYLTLAINALKNISTDKYFKLILIGASEDIIELCDSMDVCSYSWSLESEAKILPTFDLGICPTPSLKSASRLRGCGKIAIYHSLSIPYVYDSLLIASFIHKKFSLGVPVFASTVEGWEYALRECINCIERNELVYSASQPFALISSQEYMSDLILNSSLAP